MSDHKPRLAWADAAKGAAVIAVVFAHVFSKHLQHVEWGLAAPVLTAGMTVVYGLSPIRIPLFFVISGFFAANAIRRGWRQVLASKVGFYYYLYAVWLAIQTVAMQWTPAIHTSVARGIPAFIRQLLFEPTNLWYLFALAVFFAVAKVGLRAPRVMLALVAALAVSPLAGIDIGAGNLGELAQNAVWFVAGAYCKPLVERWSEAVTVPKMAGLGAVFVVPMGVMFVLDAPLPPLFAVASAAGAAFGIGLAVLAARWFPRATEWFGQVTGRNTLPIYVFQMPLIAWWHAATFEVGSAVGQLVSSSVVLAALYPLVLAAAITVVTLLLHRALAPFVPALFGMPGWLKRLGAPRGELAAVGKRHRNG